MTRIPPAIIQRFLYLHPHFYAPQSDVNFTSEANAQLLCIARDKLRRELESLVVPDTPDFLEGLYREYVSRHYKAHLQPGDPLGSVLPSLLVSKAAQSALDAGKSAGQMGSKRSTVEEFNNLASARITPAFHSCIAGLYNAFEAPPKTNPGLVNGVTVTELIRNGDQYLTGLTVGSLVDHITYYDQNTFPGFTKWHKYFARYVRGDGTGAYLVTANAFNYLNMDAKPGTDMGFIACCRIYFDRNKIFSNQIILATLADPSILGNNLVMCIPSPSNDCIIDIFIGETQFKSLSKNPATKNISGQVNKSIGDGKNKVEIAKLVLKTLVEDNLDNILVRGVRGINGFEIKRVKNDKLIVGYQERRVKLREVDFRPADMDYAELQKISSMLVGKSYQKLWNRSLRDPKLVAKKLVPVESSRGDYIEYQISIDPHRQAEAHLGMVTMRNYFRNLPDVAHCIYEDAHIQHYIRFTTRNSVELKHRIRRVRSVGVCVRGVEEFEYLIPVNTKFFEREEYSFARIRRELQELYNDIDFMGHHIEKIHARISVYVESKRSQEAVLRRIKYPADSFYYLIDGGNLSDIFNIPGVDPNTVTSTHVKEVDNVLGVSACYNACVNAMNAVLQKTGGVEIRHIRLLFRELTASGTLRGLDNQRVGRDDFLTLVASQNVHRVLSTASLFSSEERVRGSVNVPVFLGSLPPLGTGYAKVAVRGREYDGPVSNGEAFVHERKRVRKVAVDPSVLPPIHISRRGINPQLLNILGLPNIHIDVMEEFQPLIWYKRPPYPHESKHAIPSDHAFNLQSYLDWFAEFPFTIYRPDLGDRE